MLYPLVGVDGRLEGVVTRTQLETAIHDGQGARPVAELGISAPTVVHPDETLRNVATMMAQHEVDRMPVVDRERPDRVVGMLSLTMLLAARVRDLEEARDTERVLRLRIVRPRWMPARAD
jgi:CBS domain-containing protein